MLEDIILWWAGQMRDLLTAWPARRPPSPPDGLVVTADAAGTLTATLRHRRRERPLGQYAADAAALRSLAATRRGPVLLRLPPAWLLERDVVLPLAVERDLAQVLRYDMDKWTPFAAKDVAWTWQVTQRDHAQARLHLRLAVARIALWEKLATALTQAGLPVAALEFAAPDGAIRHIPLAHAVATAAARRRLTLAGAAVCAALAVAAIALPFIRQSLAGQAVEARIDALQAPVARVQALRQRAAGSTQAAGIVAAERARAGDVLHVLAAITDLLPDDTYLTELSWQARRLTLSGQSAAAARLIPALSGTPAIRDAVFVAPVTRAPGGTDHFSIRAEVAP